MDILQSPIIVAVLALLAVPGVTSGLAGVLKGLAAATGVRPEVWVYVASLALTGVALAVGGEALPATAGDPAVIVGAWLVWATANAETARRLYETLKDTVFAS